VCALANNHVLDWGGQGLSDTLGALRRAGIALAGAGEDEARARAPAVVDLGDRGRVVVVSVATGSSGVPEAWAAAASRPGIWRLPALTDEVADAVAEAATRDRRPGDVVVVSIHWGDNWGYEVSPEEVAFARRLVDAGVDVVHGHSSHHPRPVEIYRERAVLYGCGELLDDYEGIRGYEAFRPALVLLWILALAADGRLASLRAVPMRIRRFRLERATAADAAWLAGRLHLVSGRFGRAVELDADRRLVVR
jgi:poly-gamma-glutamate synthesis protein (capsule biosynthesis protein)